MNGSVITRQRATDRQRTTTDWLDSAHSFSFGHNYDPANTHFGSLIAFNEDRLAPHSGYDTHLHRDTEILSWVLDGELSHTDGAGRRAILRPGTLQLMSAGAGIEHSERNHGERPLHFLQMWLRPSELGAAPDYRQLDVADQLAAQELVRVASGTAADESELPLRCAGASLWIGDLPPHRSVELPPATYGFLFVARGSAEAFGAILEAGDELRCRAVAGSAGIAGIAGTVLAGADGVELLWWGMADDIAD